MAGMVSRRQVHLLRALREVAAGVPVPQGRGRSRHGKELFFIATDRRVMAVSIRRNGSQLEIGTPKPLFDSKIVPGNFSAFDVAKDGRFLIPTHEYLWGAPLTLATNWQAALRK